MAWVKIRIGVGNKGTLTFRSRSGDGKLAVLLTGARLEFLLSLCLSYLGEIVISKVFYINSANLKGIRTNGSAAYNRTGNDVTHKSQ